MLRSTPVPAYANEIESSALSLPYTLSAGSHDRYLRQDEEAFFEAGI